jgi:Reverse transcriptase (RNA-dependent DNA polymerase)/Endonuclease-reverse transcriptase
MRIGIINVGTLRDKTEEIVELMKERKLDIMGLCETRLQGKGRKKIHEDYVLLHTGSERKQHGVAFIVSSRIGDKIADVKHISERMMGISIKEGDSYLDLIQVYAPQQGRPEAEKDTFYEELQELADRMPHRESLLIIGDLNGHIGKERSGCEAVTGAFSIGERNREGDRIVDFCIRNQMAVMNTFYKHQESHMWTWYRWNSEAKNYTDKSMIDLVLASRKNLTTDVRAIPSVSLDSDHRMVLVKCSLRIKPPRQKPKRERLNVELFKVEEIKQQVQTRIQEVIPRDETHVNAIDDEWRDFHLKVTQITTELLGKKTIGGERKKSTPYWTQELKEAVHAKNRAFRSWMKHRTVESRTEYVQKRNVVNSQRRVAKEECWVKLGKDLEEDVQGNKKLLYNLAKSYRKGNDDSGSTVKDKDGNLLSDQVDIEQRWKQYFESLLNVQDNITAATETEEETANAMPDVIDENDISIAEVKKAVEHMQNHKAPGCDGLPAEVFKNGGDALQTWMKRIFNAAWKQGRIPEDWGKAIICPIYKRKGDKADCGNYRGISLLPHITKIYERILERRLRSHVEEKLGEWQHGFRPNRSTSDLIFSMKMILEKTWEFNDKTYLAFLDLEKAFDRVPRQKLWQAMQQAEYGVPPMLMRAVRSMYRECKSSVRSAFGEGPWFLVKTGVRQGSVLSPLLFVLLMDQVLKQAEREMGTEGDHSGTFAYADDVGLVTCSEAELQQTINIWCKVLTNSGLKLNVSKSEVMVVSRQSEKLHIDAGGQELKQVEQFKYLGVTFDSTATKETAINERIDQYSRSVGLMYPLLKDRYVPTSAKVTIYKTILRPILTYGCEAWTLTTMMRSRIQAAEMRVLRLINGVTRKDRMRNDNIRADLEVQDILQYIEETQLRWFGHVRRMPAGRTPQRWLQWKPRTTRPRGRPRKRWMDNIKEAVEKRGITLREVEREELFMDRQKWRAFFSDRP